MTPWTEMIFPKQMTNEEPSQEKLEKFKVVAELLKNSRRVTLRSLKSEGVVDIKNAGEFWDRLNTDGMGLVMSFSIYLTKTRKKGRLDKKYENEACLFPADKKLDLKDLLESPKKLQEEVGIRPARRDESELEPGDVTKIQRHYIIDSLGDFLKIIEQTELNQEKEIEEAIAAKGGLSLSEIEEHQGALSMAGEESGGELSLSDDDK